MVTAVRFSNVVAATLWVIGLPVVVITANPFVSDATYFVFGLVIVLLGLATTPMARAYPESTSALPTGFVRGFGVVACAALVVAGALLMAASAGLLGDRAPSWVSDPTLVAVPGYFAWILVASYSTRRSPALGRWVFWLGVLAGLSILVQLVISALTFTLDPGFMVTNATIPLVLISSLVTWFGLPVWLIALAVRLRAVGSDRTEQDPTHEIEVTT
jgi:hypothetical protein